MAQSLKNYTISIKFDVNKSPLSQINGAVNDIAARAIAAGGRVEKSINATLNNVNKSASGALGSLGGYLRGMAGLFAGHELIKAADEYTKAMSRIQLYAADTQQALDKIYSNAQRSGTSFVSQAELVGSVMQNQKHIGLNEDQSIQLADTFGKALSMTSQGAAQDSAALLQFVQMMGSEKVSNMDLKPLLHDSAALSKYITEISGKTTSALMELAGKGELSPKQVIGWLMEATDRVNKDFSTMPKTFGQGFTRINNAVVKFVGEWNQASAVSTTFYRFTGLIADNLSTILKTAMLLVASWRLQLFFMREGVAQSKAMAMWEGIRARFTKASLASSARQVAGMAKMAALLYGVYLIVEDLYYWWTGGLSVSGKFLGDPAVWKKKINTLKGYFSGFLGWLDKAGGAGQLAKKWGTLGIVVYTLAKLSGILKVVGFLWRRVFFIGGIRNTVMSVRMLVMSLGGVRGILVSLGWVIKTLGGGIAKVALVAGRALVAALMSVARAATAALAPLLANPITWIILAIVAALALVWYYWDDIKKATLDAWDATKSAWGGFTAWFSDLWDSAVKSVTGKWQAFRASADKLGDGLKTMFKGYVDDIVNFFSSLPDRIQVWLTQIGSLIAGKAASWAKMVNPANWFGDDSPNGAAAAGIAGHVANNTAQTNNWNPTLHQTVNVNGAATPSATGRAVAGITRNGWNTTLPNAEATY